MQREADIMNHSETADLDAATQRCIRNCTDCHNACVQTVAYCMQMSGPHLDPSHLRSLLDCAEACSASADFMLRGSALLTGMCRLCAEACERCAESCEQFSGDEQMKACAEACRRSAQSCRGVAA